MRSICVALFFCCRCIHVFSQCPTSGTISADCEAPSGLTITASTLTINSGVVVTVTGDFIMQGNAVINATGATINVSNDFKGQYSNNSITGGEWNITNDLSGTQGGNQDFSGAEITAGTMTIAGNSVDFLAGTQATINGNVVNNATVKVDGSMTMLTVNGAWLNQNGSSLTIENSGSATVTGNFDNIGGSATAGNSGGVLSVGMNFTNSGGGTVSTSGGAVIVDGTYTGSTPTGDGDGCSTGGGSCCGSMSACSTLPVDLLSFRANLSNPNEVSLVWKTVSEEDNDYFTITRSYDGITFNEIAIIKGKGTTSETTLYQFIDQSAFASNLFYQLIQTDYDGTTKKLKVAHVQNDAFENILMIYPTSGSATQDIHIRNFDEDLQSAEAYLINGSGKNLGAVAIASQGSELILKTSEKHMKPGLYMLQGRLNYIRFTRKLLITE
ncbi:MAG: hypothetical protein AAFO69_17350 [Bacteroidota bacterium]